jgi:hypothetical protein
MTFPLLFGLADSAEKAYEYFDWAQHERKISMLFKRSSVRPEVTRRMNGRFFSRIAIDL